MAPTRRSTRVQQAPAVKQLQEKKKKEDAEAAKLKVTKKAPQPKTPLKGFTGIQSGRPFIIPRRPAVIPDVPGRLPQRYHDVVDLRRGFWELRDAMQRLEGVVERIVGFKYVSSL
ncbi:unnamed protein product [Zymoseptoria tritici ST99CH_3D7]|uniref:Uncharacterized protein n=1 Tax=Zymoseptoria tritici (strain ST99CH_3D7) TaxID=1276538 RepID=A0A1X7S5I7_ZYMT9|nr:unnamed protein product [Zymoseptoria tritici ST99CH_3D7]